MRQTHLALVQRHLAAENAHDLPATLATIHPDCLFQDMALKETYLGLEGVAKYYSRWWDAFDLQVKSAARHWTIEHNLIVEPIYQGVHVGSFLGVAPTLQKIELSIAVFITFKDGLLVGERFYYDSHLLFEQISRGNVSI